MQVRKRFGQHFLHDPGIIRRIVDAVAPVVGDRIVEVGPGRGALTWSLLARAKNMDVVEIDRDLAKVLIDDSRAEGHLRVHVENVLDTDFIRLRGDGAPLKIVGNLPYNISTPLLFNLLKQRAAIGDMYFMLQKEVVDRMAAPPGGKEYGRLTVMLAAYAEVEALFDVGPGAFQPRPKVWSAIVRLRPTLEPRFDIGSDVALRTVVTAAFSHRRKTLRNGLKSLLTSEEIEACGIDPGLRPETLAPAQFGLLAARYWQLHREGERQSA
ncbi:MAG: 16S rRNA (adenine(1518)-N(6)/adenine(1519)-N(6))-dimethyltransferase RsmA [Paraburkholderia sp.]|uniref:16S rRNA (adenine(1518)-N(6)/adenine(1519)-N(6))- dimethyltransferase RsmA n=1 Tax=Paraburkholderia sp. TaxID=1926495 RepID=UPI003C642075